VQAVAEPDGAGVLVERVDPIAGPLVSGVDDGPPQDPVARKISDGAGDGSLDGSTLALIERAGI